MALLATLWVLAILLVIAGSFALSVRTEVVLAGSYVRRAQAAWMAEAGLQRAFVELQQSSVPYTMLNEYSDGTDALVLRLDSDDDEALQMQDGFFVVNGFDESALINLNIADEDTLRNLLLDEPELVDAILDWRDSDDLVREAGAESDFYASLDERYRSRDDWFETIEELLLLRDVTPARLFGADGLSPLADPAEVGQVDQDLTPLANLFTTTSYDQNVDLEGNQRLDLRTATEEELTEQFGDILEPEQIQSIIQYRDQQLGQQGEQPGTGAEQQPGMPGAGAGAALPGALTPEEEAALADAQSQLAGLAGELGGGAVPGEGQPGAGQPGGEPQPELSVAGLVTVLDRDALREVYDLLTGTDAEHTFGRINLNTATAEVLSALTGMDPSIAELIVRERQNEPFETVADLLRLAEIDDQMFQDLAPLLTTRGLVFRLRAEGTIGEGTQAMTNTIEALVLVEYQPASEDEAAAGTTPTEGEPAQRLLRLVYRRME